MKILYTAAGVDIQELFSESSHFIEIAKELTKIGNDLLVLAPAYAPRRAPNYGLKIKFLPTRRRRFLSYLLAEFLRAVYFPFLIMKWHPDVIYARKDSFDLLPPIWAYLFQIPYIVEVNGIIEDESRLYKSPGWMISILKWIEKVNYTLSAKIISVTEGIKQELSKRFRVQKSKIVVISNGVNAELFRPLDKKGCRKRLRLNEDAFYAGFVGSFAPWQGLETLVEAAKKVKEKGYFRIRYVLVGDGELKQTIERMVREYELANEVVFTGRVPYEEVVYYINAFDVALAPFICERNAIIGLSPLKLYEYLACSRPVIASWLDGVREVIEEGRCGYLFEAGDVEGLAERIIQSYHEGELLQEMGERGRRLVESKYTWKTTAERIAKILEEIIETKSKRERD